MIRSKNEVGANRRQTVIAYKDSECKTRLEYHRLIKFSLKFP